MDHLKLLNQTAKEEIIGIYISNISFQERHQRRNSEEDCIRLHEALCGKSNIP